MCMCILVLYPVPFTEVVPAVQQCGVSFTFILGLDGRIPSEWHFVFVYL